jgi:8-oxo-dGTP pyrophosphatase MutT (NUDIX family)
MTLADRIRTALARQDYDASQIWPGDGVLVHRREHITPTPAAVLVGLIDRPRPTVLLTQRMDHLTNHAGQVAFPGGRVDPDDAAVIAAALREAEEEVGLSRDHVTVIDMVEPYQTGTNFLVTPVVAAVSSQLTVKAHPGEVAEIFEVPVDVVFNPASFTLQQAHWKGMDRQFYELQWQDKRIWGATAAMLVNIGHRLRGLW